MKEKLTTYLKSLSHSNAINQQYQISEFESNVFRYNDPLMEDQFEKVPGLIHKYTNRALIKVSYECAAHCRFCTRIRQIGDKAGRLNDINIDNIISYLIQHPEIDDVILSGGDPFFTPLITYQILTRLQAIESIKIIRIGTRMPFQSPDSFESKPIHQLLELINQIACTKPFFILVHIEHPDELTDKSKAVIKKLKSLPVTLLSQTVFLKKINDSVEILVSLFKQLYHLGIIPYYLYHCDNVTGLEHFQVDINIEKEIAIQLRAQLSGIACPLLVEDIENGFGKIPIH